MIRDTKGRRVVNRYVGTRRAPSLRPRADDLLLRPAESEAMVSRVPLTAISDLDLAIKLGWGDTPQTELPDDWRTRKRSSFEKTLVPRGKAAGA